MYEKTGRCEKFYIAPKKFTAPSLGCLFLQLVPFQHCAHVFAEIGVVLAEA